jgi:hypothetical protein
VFDDAPKAQRRRRTSGPLKGGKSRYLARPRTDRRDLAPAPVASNVLIGTPIILVDQQFASVFSDVTMPTTTFVAWLRFGPWSAIVAIGQPPLSDFLAKALKGVDLSIIHCESAVQRRVLRMLSRFPILKVGRRFTLGSPMSPAWVHGSPCVEERAMVGCPSFYRLYG